MLGRTQVSPTLETFSKGLDSAGRAPRCAPAHVTGRKALAPVTGWEKYASGGLRAGRSRRRRPGREARQAASSLWTLLDVAGGREGECPSAVPGKCGLRKGEATQDWGGVQDRRGWEGEDCEHPLFAGRVARGFLAIHLGLMNYNMNRHLLSACRALLSVLPVDSSSCTID